MGLSEKMFRQLSVSSGKTFPGITKAAGKLQSPRPYLHFSLILFYKRLYFLVDALGIQSILLNQFQRRTGLSEHIVDTDLHDFRRLLLGKDVAYGASQSADHGMLLDRYHFSGPVSYTHLDVYKRQVPAHSIKVSRVSMYSGYRHVIFPFAYGAFTLSGRLSQNLSARINESIMRSEPRNARIPVWPLSISLAATLEIDVSFSSSGYLDVSVHRVPLHTLWIGVWIHEVCSCGFPHSDIYGSKDICSSP